ncbi:MAG TPA: TRAM domain-containing protein, partial [Opitutales bacterium]|nr:TRAM domain-containing protein [Opitutales bacterium]
MTTELHPHAPFNYHDEVDMRIETLTNLGLGLGRVDGWVIMVPFTIPGELVRVRIYRNHKNYSDADLLEVLEPSAERISPQCPLFGSCGGCQYQHMSYESQLAWKTDQVRNLLRNIPGATECVHPAIGSPKTYHYRSKLTPHYPRPKKGDTATLPIGFLKQGTTHSIIDVPECPIATEAINEALPKLRAELRDKAVGFKRGGTLLIRHSREGVTQNSQAIVSEQIGS